MVAFSEQLSIRLGMLALLLASSRNYHSARFIQRYHALWKEVYNTTIKVLG
jgi:hypothetical protein